MKQRVSLSVHQKGKVIHTGVFGTDIIATDIQFELFLLSAIGLTLSTERSSYAGTAEVPLGYVHAVPGERSIDRLIRGMLIKQGFGLATPARIGLNRTLTKSAQKRLPPLSRVAIVMPQ